jgi:hypothetical protein
MAHAEIRVKGTVMQAVVRAAGASEPGPRRDALLAALNPELRDAAQTNMILASVWYPIAWHRELLRFVAEDGGTSGLRGTVRRSTRDNVGTIHRVLMRVLSPETLLTRSARIFGAFFEGQCEAEPRGPGVTWVTWTDCHGFDMNCWIAQRESLEEIVAMAGAKVTRRAVIVGGREKDPGMVIELCWR